MKKRIRERVVKGKRDRTASDDVGGKSLTSILTSVNIFEESKRDKT